MPLSSCSNSPMFFCHSNMPARRSGKDDWNVGEDFTPSRELACDEGLECDGGEFEPENKQRR